MRPLLILSLLVLTCISLEAQSYHSDSRKAVKKYEEAVELFKAMDPEGAELLLIQALKADEEFIEARQLLAQIYFDAGRLDEAISHYSRTLEIDSTGNPEAYRLLAGMHRENCNYTAALELLETYLAFPGEQIARRGKALELREHCLFALEALEHPVPFEPQNLGPAVNSEHSEYWPALSVDENLLLYTVLLPVGKDSRGQDVFQEDFYWVRKEGEGWTGRESAGGPLNTPGNEGAHSITADGRFLYFTACMRKDGRGQCDLYMSEWTGEAWGKAQNLGSQVNSRYSEKQPSISADGRILVFSSNRPGGLGGYDLWMSVKEDGKWSRPVNLGEQLNTSGLEQSPFMHSDMQSLYFSSTGWPGLGKGDLFRSTRRNDSTWTRPENLGHPINTCGDEFGLSVNASGTQAYFASDRDMTGNTDIYSFEMPGDLRPTPVSYMSGRVYDAESYRGIEASIILLDLADGKVVMELDSREGKGEYLLALPGDRDYALNVSAPGYLFYSEHFAFRGLHSRVKPFRRDVPLQAIEVGSSMVLNNIFFELDSHSLLPESEVELQRVLDFLEQHPRVHMEISGHTDNTGNPAYNLELSRKRARAVVGYLLGNGIDPSRLEAIGYGDTRPLVDNLTEEARAQNRRTEFKIINIAE